MSEEGRYLIYLTEQYALAHGIDGGQAMRVFLDHDLLDYICDMYYTYHTERVENAITDLDRRITSASRITSQQ